MLQLSQSDCLRFTEDFIRYHLQAMRGGWRPPEHSDSQRTSRLDEAPWHLDSLELVTLSGMVSESFQIHTTGIEDLLLARPSIREWSGIIGISLSHNAETVVFYTSGSTGRPKPVRHSAHLLQEEIGCLAAELPEGLHRLVTPLPAHHIYGFLFTILLPQQLGLPLDTIAGVHPRFVPGDGVITIPAWLGSWHTSGVQLSSGMTVVSSTAALEEELADWVLDSGATLLEVFGSSETSGIGVRRNREPGFRLLPFWQRATDPATGEVALVRDGLPAAVPLPDNLTWLGERLFSFEGRKDQAVAIGGVNVFPAQVEQRLGAHPLVDAAAVRSFDTPTGARLKAFIVPAPGVPPLDLEQELRGWASRNLSDPERPARYQFGSELPQSPLGKPADF